MTPFKRVLDLGKVDYNNSGRRNCRVTVEIEVSPAQHAGHGLTADLEPIPADAMELSICGNIWNPSNTDCYSCGQNIDEIAKLVRTPRVKRICEIWERWHLNGMKAGTREQNEALSAMPEENAGDHYSRACEWLRERGLYEVSAGPEVANGNGAAVQRTYKYGHSWLYEPLPAEIVEELRVI